jgi:hypothetical protein
MSGVRFGKQYSQCDSQFTRANKNIASGEGQWQRRGGKETRTAHCIFPKAI